MANKTVRNILITVFVLIAMTFMSSVNQLLTSQQSALSQWKHVERAYLSQAQLSSQLSRLLPNVDTGANPRYFLDPRSYYRSLVDHERQIQHITAHKAWLETFLTQPSVQKHLTKTTRFINVYTNSIKPKLLREAIDYNQQVAFYNSRLNRFTSRLVTRYKRLSPLPYLSIGSPGQVVVLTQKGHLANPS